MQGRTIATLLCVIIVAGGLSPYSSNPISATRNNANLKADYAFAFETDTRIDSDGFVTVVFPSEYPSPLADSLCAGFELIEANLTEVPCTSSGRQVEFQVGTLDAGSHTLLVRKISNPVSAGGTGSFRIFTSERTFVIAD